MTAEHNYTASYALVNGLNLYYEIHGTGEALVLLHGAYMSTNAMEPLLSDLAKTRQVIALDFQTHGRTGDIDRPIRMETLADDVAALLHFLNIPQTDIFGYSLGAGVALQVALRYPELVRKLVLASVSYKTAGMYPEMLAGMDYITPEVFEGTPTKANYDQIAPNPANFPVLVEKLKDFGTSVYDWPAESLQSIKAPTFLILGDSDIVKPEHVVEMFRLFGGGVPGDMTGLPNSRLAILPGTTHVTVMERSAWIVPMVEEFLNLPLPAQA
ncbi:MAG: alpha/beta hydrolase [Chloroflexi bacterium]|mgnify:CR=1 FL=1|nr:alpha/beta hydrolase [Chloroflexota bacterium]OJV89367.1 MAG: alpha/beta hydrolase [Chloroflexi bacterium 54-19]